MKKKYNPIWKFIFIPLLIINLMWGFNIYQNERYSTDLGFLGVTPSILILLLIDLITVVFFIATKHPRGKTRFISYSALIIIALVITFTGVLIFTSLGIGIFSVRVALP